MYSEEKSLISPAAVRGQRQRADSGPEELHRKAAFSFVCACLLFVLALIRGLTS